MRIGNKILPLMLLSFWGLSSRYPLHAEDHDLSLVVKQMESHYQVKRTHIPFWGLAKFFIKVAKPGRGIDLAIFEDQNLKVADHQQFERKLLDGLGPAWQPIVRVHSRKDKEWVLILTKAMGKKVKMMILSIEPSEAAVVKINLHLKDLSTWMEKETYGKRRKGVEG